MGTGRGRWSGSVGQDETVQSARSDPGAPAVLSPRIEGHDPPAGSGRDGRLLPPSWRRHIPLIVGLCFLWVLGWAIAVRNRNGPLGIERRLNDALTSTRPHTVHVAFFFADMSRPAIFAGLLAIVVGLCAAGRSLRAVAVLGISVVVTFGACEELKSLVNRHGGFGLLTFPSGHVGLTSAVSTVVFLLARPGGPLGRRLPAAARVLIISVAIAAIPSVAASMVILGAHYVTDTIAAAPLGMGITLAAAWLTDSATAAVLYRGKEQ
jgi:membrane-associated phospholipid phosphatase